MTDVFKTHANLHQHHMAGRHTSHGGKWDEFLVYVVPHVADGNGARRQEILGGLGRSLTKIFNKDMIGELLQEDFS